MKRNNNLSLDFNDVGQQPTAFGRQNRDKSHRYHKSMRFITDKVNQITFASTVMLCAIAVIQLIYIMFIVQHENVAISDGSEYSCMAASVQQ